MSKSERIYLSKGDINSGEAGDIFSCPIHKSMERRGILKGKCFGVGLNHVKVGPNKKYLEDYWGEAKIVFKLSKKATNFIEDFDDKVDVVPTHVTLIAPKGKE